MIYFALLLFTSIINCDSDLDSQEIGQNIKLKALIVDGQNNHGIWPKTTMMMKSYLEQTGLFEVDIARTAHVWQGPHFDKSIGLDDISELLSMYPISESSEERSLKGRTYTTGEEAIFDDSFTPDFSQYDVVINNMGWLAAPWPEETKRAFEKYIDKGGGLVIVHAANNSWGDWDEYNRMIGLGGWGERSEKTGPYVYYNNKGQLIRDDGDGQCGSHGPEHEYVIVTRQEDHPIMKGLPAEWLHTQDELYDRLRGPAKNMTVLATTYSDKVKNRPGGEDSVGGSGRHEPMLMTINYGKGRVFHTAMGHMDYSMECIGFKTTFQRGAEWAASGKVTQKVPKEFPNAKKSKSIKWAN